ncbi:MAG: type II secretion system secretin GspD [Gammaproteobacteria bacterium]|nr:type II secretion system secretin GspD [Gammaproteobacteria bacterium]
MRIVTKKLLLSTLCGLTIFATGFTAIAQPNTEEVPYGSNPPSTETPPDMQQPYMPTPAMNGMPDSMSTNSSANSNGNNNSRFVPSQINNRNNLGNKTSNDASSGGGATLNLSDADIRVLINTVSEITGKNFIIDPRVKAKITVVSSKPMQKDELYEVFLSILQVHGFAAIPSKKGLIKIVPDAIAKQGAIPTVDGNQYRDSDQLVTRVLQVQNISANQLIPILRPLIPNQGHLAAYAPTNVLVISDQASNINRILHIIRQIDQVSNADVEIIRVENAAAGEIVRILNSLAQKDQKAAPESVQTSFIADERTNSILLTGDSGSRKRISKLISELDAPLTSTGNTRVFFLKYADAKELTTILQGVSAKTSDGKTAPAAGNKSDVDIQADITNNALIITAPASLIRQFDSVIKQLDIPRAQVLIEAIIAEVSTDLATELGSQLLVNGSEDGRGPVGGVLFRESNDISSWVTDTPIVKDGLNLAIGRTDVANQFALVLRALQGDAATNILSTPTLVTLDNVEAEIVFGQNVPFVTGSYSNTGANNGSTNPFQTIQRQDVGLTLKVKPQINEGTSVKLNISQEVSNIASSSSGASDIVTNKRSIKTEVLVDDGQMLVLGGLIEDQFTDSVQKVPLLGSIPIIGHLFRYTKTQKVKRNLMVFIRPVILSDSVRANYFTQKKYSAFKERQDQAKIGKRGLLRDSAAKLPPIDTLFTPMPPATTPIAAPVVMPQATPAITPVTPTSTVVPANETSGTNNTTPPAVTGEAVSTSTSTQVVVTGEAVPASTTTLVAPAPAPASTPANSENISPTTDSTDTKKTMTEAEAIAAAEQAFEFTPSEASVETNTLTNSKTPAISTSSNSNTATTP